MSKIANSYLPHDPHSTPSLSRSGVTSYKIRDEPDIWKTQNHMKLPYSEEIVIVRLTMWTQSKSVTDRLTDRIKTTKTALCIASRGKNVTPFYLLLFLWAAL